MPPAPLGEFDAPHLRAERRRERAERRVQTRGRWWYPLAVLAVVIAAAWGLLRADQFLAHHVIWPAQGARFVEVRSDSAGPAPATEPRLEGARLTIVVGGLNRKSGTEIARALPALRQPGTRVFSLVHGSGISEDDLADKFDTLLAEHRPREVNFYGSSMGGDVVLNLALHLERRRPEVPTTQPDQGSPPAAADPTRLPPPPLPTIGVLMLDCTPLGPDDVRDSSRTRADALTSLTEALDTEGGAVARVAAEVLAQREQWSTGAFPFLQVRREDLRFKVDQVLRDKIGRVGISTRLVKDQYGVIRRMRADEVFATLSPSTTILYLLPADRAADRTVDVAQVEDELAGHAAVFGLDVRIVPIEGAHHASAEADADAYNRAIERVLDARHGGQPPPMS